MTNPNGPYPGRQLFLGMTAEGNPAAAYLVTGRSAPSRERKATRRENNIIIGPLGNVPYDPLRHYTAIKCDDASGIISVSNGIQTDAIYETYRLLYNVGSHPAGDFLEKIMEGAGSEPDSVNTPRIGGIISSHSNAPFLYAAIKKKDVTAVVRQIKPVPGMFTGISTYNGDFENPTPFSNTSLPELKFNGKEAKELAEFLFNLSEAKYKGEDIRVCAVGGVYTAETKKWSIAMVNAHEK